MDYANLFNPFSSLPPKHENRLTWAFLVALKYDPLLQNFLRQLVESRLPLKAREHGIFWERARVSTQKKWINPSTNHLVSVLLTDETIQDIQVEWSERNAVYDGVIEFPDGLTLIVENKPSRGNVWAKQLSPSRSSFSGNIDDCTLHGSAICLEWSEILEGVLKYVDSDIAPFGGREISSDFLSFAEEFHPGLTPYRRFRLCGDRPEALRRRTIRLLDALASVCQKTPLSELSCHDPPHHPRQLQPNFAQEDASDRSEWGDLWWTGPDLRDAAIGCRSRLLGSGFKG